MKKRERMNIMKRSSVAKKKKVQEAVADFQISDNLRQFMPPTTTFTIGVHTPWFRAPKLKTGINVPKDQKTGT